MLVLGCLKSARQGNLTRADLVASAALYAVLEAKFVRDFRRLAGQVKQMRLQRPRAGGHAEPAINAGHRLVGEFGSFDLGQCVQFDAINGTGWQTEFATRTDITEYCVQLLCSADNGINRTCAYAQSTADALTFYNPGNYGCRFFNDHRLG